MRKLMLILGMTIIATSVNALPVPVQAYVNYPITDGPNPGWALLIVSVLLITTFCLCRLALKVLASPSR